MQDRLELWLMKLHQLQKMVTLVLKGFLTGVEEAATEVAAPFIDESIWTEACG